MVYAAELDDVRQEVRRGYASNTLRFWPKVSGVGNVLISSASVSLHAPGESTASLGSPAVSLAVVNGVSRVDVPTDASDTAAWALDEDYRADITWVYGAQTELTTLRFDVAREPMNPMISLNDLQNEVSDISQRLTTMARATASGRTAEQLASVLGVKAWGHIRQRLKATLQEQGRILPRCLIDREALRLVTTAQAVKLAFLSASGGPETETAFLADYWTTETDSRFRALGRLSYDEDQDGVEDTVLRPLTASRVRRSW